ncbi:MAG: hypothetical protein H0X47_01295 [Nitrospirales bacterium]|nr:hypothetical protein [Nitrospirales bacterium]
MWKNLLIILTVLVALPITVHASDGQDPDIVIKQLCEAKWGDAYGGQQYCLEKEYRGLESIQEFGTRYPQGTKEYTILASCLDKWTDNIGEKSYEMVVYCTNRQVKVHRNLN